MNQKEPSIPAQVGIGALIVAAFLASFNGLALFF